MLVAGPIETYKDYSQFNSLKEFNKHIEMFLAIHKDKFTKGELVAFKRLIRFSAKFRGVANAKIGTILKAINEKTNGIGISRSTFERMLRKATSLRILTVKNTTKRKGGRGHNVYIFNTFDVLKKEKLTYRKNEGNPTDTRGEQVKSEGEASILSETGILKDINKRNRYVGQAIPNVSQSLDHTFTPSYIPKNFVSTVKPFFDNAKEIVKLWSSSSVAIKKVTRLDYPESAIDTVIEAFKETVYKYKGKKIKNDFNGYFYGVLTNKLNDQVKEFNTQYADSNYKRQIPFYNWLE